MSKITPVSRQLYQVSQLVTPARYLLLTSFVCNKQMQFYTKLHLKYSTSLPSSVNEFLTTTKTNDVI